MKEIKKYFQVIILFFCLPFLFGPELDAQNLSMGVFFRPDIGSSNVLFFSKTNPGLSINSKPRGGFSAGAEITRKIGGKFSLVAGLHYNLRSYQVPLIFIMTLNGVTLAVPTTGYITSQSIVAPFAVRYLTGSGLMFRAGLQFSRQLTTTSRIIMNSDGSILQQNQTYISMRSSLGAQYELAYRFFRNKKYPLEVGPVFYTYFSAQGNSSIWELGLKGCLYFNLSEK